MSDVIHTGRPAVKVRRSLSLSPETIEQAEELARYDLRSVSNEVEWLVDREWQRRRMDQQHPPTEGGKE